MSIYDYTVPTADGGELSLKDMAGKVMVIVNTATGCGFTPQYKELEELYEELHEDGLEIIDIPCNQFGNQAPGTDEEIHEFCTLKYDTKFPQMKKSDVNGPDALPVYAYLKEQKGFEGLKGAKGLALVAFVKKMDKDYKNNPDIKWNFTKFVVDREGEVVARFEPTDSMKDFEKLVKELI